MAFEEDLFRALNSGSANPALDVLALGLDFSALFFVMALYAIPLWSRGRRTLAFDYLLALVVVVVVTEALKFGFDRPRPAELYAGVRVLPLPFLSEFADPAFPSGHTSRAFVFAVLLGLHGRRWFRWLIPFAVLVGWARIYQGVHYPSDVLGGAAVGIAFAFLFWKLNRWPRYGSLRTRIIGRWLSPARGAHSESNSSPPPTPR